MEKFLCIRNKSGILAFSGNASRECLTEGVWADRTDYMKCMEIEPIEPVDYKDLTAIIYIAGYTISLLALSSSLAIFLRFRLVKSIY